MNQQIIILLDTSSNMEGQLKNTIKALNRFIEIQREKSPERRIWIYRFNLGIDLMVTARLKKCPLIDEGDYTAEDTASLYDSINDLVKNFHTDILNTFVVITGSEEESSRRIKDPDHIRKNLTALENIAHWNCIYICNSENQKKEGNSMGFYVNEKMTFNRVYKDLSVGVYELADTMSRLEKRSS